MKTWFRVLSVVLSLIMCVAAMCVPVSAEDAQYVVTIYNEQNGLPTGEANVVLQTSDGYIWIGGYGGLIRYDGSSFRNFSMEDGLQSSSIRALYESSDGKLLVGTNDVGIYVLEEDTFRKIECTEENAFLCIRDFAETSDGTIYAVSNSGVGIVRDGTLLPIQTDGVNEETFYSIACDRYDRLWLITTHDYALVLNREGEILSKIDPDALGVSDGFYSVTSNAAGDIFLGAQVQIAALQFASESLQPDDFDITIHHTGSVVTHNMLNVAANGDLLISGLNGFGVLSADGSFMALGEQEHAVSVNCAIRDYEGNYWLASSSYGVIKYANGCFRNENALSGLSETSVNAITRSGDVFYVGMDTGLAIFDADWNPMDAPIEQQLAGVRIRSLITDVAGRVWMAVYAESAIVCYDPSDQSVTSYGPSQGIHSSKGRVVYLLRDGSIAAGTQHGVAVIRNDTVTAVYNEEDGLTTTSALCIIEGSEGELLVGSDGGGIYRIQNGVVTNHGFHDGLGEGVVLRMIPDSDTEGAYFVSAGSSLYYWKDNTFTKIENFAKAPGSVFDFYDIDGKLWILQNNGILAVDKAALLSGKDAYTVEHTFSHGLTGSLNANTWNYLDTDGTIYVATRRGVNSFYFHELANSMPKGIINSVTVDDEVYEHPASLALSSSATRVTVDFAALSFTGTARLQISYQLEGFDDEETLLTDVQSMRISYTNLPGGEYRFIVKLLDPNGVEEPVTVSLPITKERRMVEQPFFWVLLLLSVIAFSAGIVMLIARAKINSIRKRQNEYRSIVNQALRTFARAIDAKDPYTNGHSVRVAEYSCEIAKRMGMSADEQERIYYMALMHDIGKIGIPDGILKKPGALSEEERQIIQTHVTIGGDILKDFTALDGISQGARYHHERYDGQGYCGHKAAEEIPLVARIIGVADTYDAMSSDRCYRKALSEDVILSELNKGIGTQFDPAIVPYMLEMIQDGFAPSQSERTRV